MNESKAYGWVMLLIFVVVSTYFNIQNSPDDINSQIAHAVVPVALCLSTEALMILIHRYIKKQAEASTPTQEYQADLVQQQQSAKRRGCAKVSDNATKIHDHFLKHPEASITGAAHDLGLSISTVRRHKKRLIAPNIVQQGDVS
jgi:hypothetical protein